MYVPKPVSREALYVYLHECAHHHLGHTKPDYREPLWKQEYEAEQWATTTMRREGLSVPRAMIASAKQYVGECADIDKKKGREGPPSRVRKWIRAVPKAAQIPNLRKPTKRKKPNS
jgi:hypothetical protein